MCPHVLEWLLPSQVFLYPFCYPFYLGPCGQATVTFTKCHICLSSRQIILYEYSFLLVTIALKCPSLLSVHLTAISAPANITLTRLLPLASCYL